MVKKTWILRKHLSKRPLSFTSPTSSPWPSPFIEVAWVTCAARFHRIARLWTSNEDQEAAVMAQSVVEVIRFLGGFFRGPGSSGMTGFEGVWFFENGRIPMFFYCQKELTT